MRNIPTAVIDALAFKVIGAAMEVHKEFGPGLLESAYHEAMEIELRRRGIAFASGTRRVLEYKGEPLGTMLEIDLLVEGCLVVEIKSVERLANVHQAQTITYLKLTGCPAGLIMNFNHPTLKAGLKRVDHPKLYVHGRWSEPRSEQTLAEADARPPDPPQSPE